MQLRVKIAKQQAAKEQKLRKKNLTKYIPNAAYAIYRVLQSMSETEPVLVLLVLHCQRSVEAATSLASAERPQQPLQTSLELASLGRCTIEFSAAHQQHMLALLNMAGLSAADSVTACRSAQNGGGCRRTMTFWDQCSGRRCRRPRWCRGSMSMWRGLTLTW